MIPEGIIFVSRGITVYPKEYLLQLMFSSMLYRIITCIHNAKVLETSVTASAYSDMGHSLTVLLNVRLDGRNENWQQAKYEGCTNAT